MSKKSVKLHLEILDKSRSKIFVHLKEFGKYGYLAGGTALALQIGHRLSYDFDVFCHKKISDSLINICRDKFSPKQVLINSDEEFTFLAKNNVKITFLYYPFVFKNKLVQNKISLPLLSVLDIAAAKAYALNRRGSCRDYVDLYFLLKKGLITAKQVVNNAKKVYGELFSEKLFLGQLVYFGDLDKNELRKMIFISEKLSFKIMNKFFEEEVKRYKF